MERKKKNETILYIIVPCYNETQVLPVSSSIFLEELTELISDGLVSKESRIMFG